MNKPLITLALALFLAVPGHAKGFVTHLTVTTYNASDNRKTKDGTRVNNRKLKAGTQRIVAISRDLLWAIPLGSVVEIEGYGQYEVRDTMAEHITMGIDILQHPSQPNFKKKDVKIKVIKKGKQDVNTNRKRSVD